MKKSLFLVVAIIGLGFLFTGCTKTVTNQVNQAYSMNSDVNPSDWQVSQDGTTATFTLNVGNQNISNDNFNQEGVLVYIAAVDNSGNIGEFTALPVSNYNGYNISVSHVPSSVYVDIRNINGGAVLLPTQKYYLKVVFIDAVALSQSSINLKNYSAVKAAFHLSN